MTSNYSRIKIYLIDIKANLILDKIRLNIPFNFAITATISFVLMSFTWLRNLANLSGKTSWILDNQIIITKLI